MTDVVGMLTSSDQTHLGVETRSGHVRIARSDVVAAKVVPPRPVRRAAPHLAVSATDLERVMVEGNPPIERERLGGWLLRAGGGYTGRANSVLPLGEPDRPMADAVDVAEQWYGARGLEPQFAPYGPPGFEVADDPLGAELLGRGYRPRLTAVVMTGATAGMPEPHLPQGCHLTAQDHLTDEWLAATDGRALRTPEAARAVLTGPREQSFLSVRDDDGAILAVARAPRNDGWAGVFGVRVLPGRRRRGLGAALTCAAVAEARAHGIRSMFLQVESENAPAIALYERLGFTTHHCYRYLVLP